MNYSADDATPHVVHYEADEGKTDEGKVDYGELQENAESAQRLAMCRLMRKHVKGSMELAFPDETRKRTPEKMFNVSKLIEWNEGDPVVVVDALRAGRLRARLSARMGLGKSTKLATYVARAMDYRVLHVALDAHALQQAGIYMHTVGIGKFSRRWSAQKKALVSCMTYADFNGYMNTTRRAELFKSFDLIIFDEAFVATADVCVATRCFSVYAPATTNLLLCSATISTDRQVEETGSSGLGVFRQMPRNVTLTEAIDSQKLISDYLVDRTIVSLPNNEQIYSLVEMYESNGVDVKFLDDAALYEGLRDVEKWLEGDSTTPRVVVVHSSYLIAFNFPIGYNIMFPYEEILEITDTTVVPKLIPLTEEMVVQGKSRAGRGIVQGSGGIIMSDERSRGNELGIHDRVLAFVKLCAASIMPLRNAFWEVAYRLFPEGLSINAAQTLLKVCLPPEVAVRYMAQDGRFAKRYCRALNVYTQPDHFLLPSDHEDPVGRDKWLVEDLVCIGGGKRVPIKVPMRCEGELKIMLHAIEMIADGNIHVPRWRPERGFAMNDGYDSEEEMTDSRFKPGAPILKLRRIEDSVKPLPVLPTSEVAAIPWAYRPLEGSEGLRRGGYIDSERCREALMELERNLLEYKIPDQRVVDVIETPNGSETPVLLGTGDVESPGGSVICSLPVRICEKMNVGEGLLPEEIVKVVNAARVDIPRFVQSKLFDCFSGPWDSILTSLHEPDVIGWIVKRGLASDTYNMVDCMRGRFNVELVSVLSQSNVFKRTFLGIFQKIPSTDRMMRAIRTGKFDGIAQTSGFISRVKLVKELIDSTLVLAETKGVYLPSHITNAQRSLPLHGRSIVGYVGQDVHTIPTSWVKELRSSSGSVTSSSDERYMSGKLTS